MSGTGNGIGASGLLPELPLPDSVSALQPQWNDAVQVAITVQIAPNAAAAALPGDPVMATSVALDLVTPTGLSPGVRPPGALSEEMGAEGPEQRPAGLTDPTPSIDSMAPVTAAMAGQGGGAANLLAPLAPSADLPSHLIAVLQAAGYRPAIAGQSADGAGAAVASGSARATAGSAQGSDAAPGAAAGSAPGAEAAPGASARSGPGAEAAFAAAVDSAPGADAVPAAAVGVGSGSEADATPAAMASSADAGPAATGSIAGAVVASDVAVAFASPALTAVASPSATAEVAMPALDAEVIAALTLYPAPNFLMTRQGQADPALAVQAVTNSSARAQTEPATVAPITVRDGAASSATIASPGYAGAAGSTNAARPEVGTEPGEQALGQAGIPSSLQPLTGVPAAGQQAPMQVTVGPPDAPLAGATQAALGTYPANPYMPVVAILTPPYEIVRPRSSGPGCDTDGLGWRDASIVSYAERRPVSIDLAPAAVAIASWRLDDTQALVTVRQDGSAAATARAGQLYRALLDGRVGLAAIQPGEGFVTWDGSPLWLSLAGIGKPAALGVLHALPGRIHVMRTEHGDWLVEHAGGPWPAAHATRHSAGAGDDEALLLDVLYGVASLAPAALFRFEDAVAAVRFAGAAPGPAGWRAQEAWALVGRCCALLAAQRKIGTTPQFQALQVALAVVLDGAAPVPHAPPVTREDCISIALSGDPVRFRAALSGLGRATLTRACRGDIDGVGLLEALGLAVWLGRLTGTPAGRSSYLRPRGVGPTGNAALPAWPRVGGDGAGARHMPAAMQP